MSMILKSVWSVCRARKTALKLSVLDHLSVRMQRDVRINTGHQKHSVQIYCHMKLDQHQRQLNGYVTMWMDFMKSMEICTVTMFQLTPADA